MHEYEDRPVSIGDWLVTLLVLGIPLINIIFYVYWAFSTETAPSKRNYCIACLIFGLISLLVVFLFFAVFGGIAALSHHF